MGSPEIGSPAPDFSTDGLRLAGGVAEKATYSLSGRPAGSGPLVLAFYPGDDTPTCTRQMCSYSSGLESFLDLGAEVWGISPQGLASHEKFARKHDLRLPLLADEDKAVSRAYGVLRLGGIHVARAVFVIDAGGTVRWRHISTVGITYQDTAKLTSALRDLAATA